MTLVTPAPLIDVHARTRNVDNKRNSHKCHCGEFRVTVNQVSANRKRQSDQVGRFLFDFQWRSNSNPDVALVIDFIGGYPFNHAVSSLRCP